MLAQKALQKAQNGPRELLGGMGGKVFPWRGGHLFVLQANECFFTCLAPLIFDCLQPPSFDNTSMELPCAVLVSTSYTLLT